MRPLTPECLLAPCACPLSLWVARAQHLVEVEAVADGMLARLDELTATLGTVRFGVRCAACLPPC